MLAAVPATAAKAAGEVRLRQLVASCLPFPRKSVHSAPCHKPGVYLVQKSNQIKADSPAPADAVIKRAQFQQIAPNAAPEAVDALFASGIGRQSPITRTLHQYGITEPHVVAQFLTALSLASDEFTNFNRPIFGLSLIDWLTARAREWRDSGANEEAAEWNWVGIIDGYVGTMYAIPMIYWNDVHKRLAKVCAALGVEDRSDEFALEDHGASEM